jgi:hypothetical protein
VKNEISAQSRLKKKGLRFVMNQIVESQNLEKSSIAMRRILTGTSDLFKRGQFEGTVSRSMIRFHNEIHFVLFFASVGDEINYRFLHYFTSSLRSAENVNQIRAVFLFFAH